jgi:hypothetical protein
MPSPLSASAPASTTRQLLIDTLRPFSLDSQQLARPLACTALSLRLFEIRLARSRGRSNGQLCREK